MTGHDTYIRDDQRVDLCLSHENKRVVVRTAFAMVDGRWTQTMDARHFHKAGIVAAENLIRKMGDDLEDDGFALTSTRTASQVERTERTNGTITEIVWKIGRASCRERVYHPV